MIIPDVNLLLYAYNLEAKENKVAAAWWSSCLDGDELIGLPINITLGFLRLATSSRVLAHPMTPARATEHIRSWLAHPNVQQINPAANHLETVLGLVEETGVAANLVSDIQLVALALDHEATLHTADADFARFPQIKWYNPILKTHGKRRS